MRQSATVSFRERLHRTPNNGCLRAFHRRPFFFLPSTVGIGSIETATPKPSRFSRYFELRFKGCAQDLLCLYRSNLGAVLLNGAIALASGPVQLLAIENSDGAVLVFNDVISSEQLGSEADAGAVGTGHGGEEIVGDGQDVGIDAILSHEQPTGEALLDAMQTIASGSLCYLQSKKHRVQFQLAA